MPNLNFPIKLTILLSKCFNSHNRLNNFLLSCKNHLESTLSRRVLISILRFQRQLPAIIRCCLNLSLISN